MREGRDKGKKDILNLVFCLELLDLAVIGVGQYLVSYFFFFRRIDVKVIIQENDNVSG